MSRHLQIELDKLRKKILALGTNVEESVRLAFQALQNRDIQIVKQVKDADDIIDQQEVEVEEECLKILALHQPVAIDLRFIVGVLKMNNDLERIGDEAVNLVNKAQQLALHPPLPINFQFDQMSRITREMLRDALDAMINMDTVVAKRVCASDDKVDEMKVDVREKVRHGFHEHPDNAEALIASLGVARNLERIADLATNIAEDVIYMVNGEIVRHGGTQ